MNIDTRNLDSNANNNTGEIGSSSRFSSHSSFEESTAYLREPLMYKEQTVDLTVNLSGDD